MKDDDDGNERKTRLVEQPKLIEVEGRKGKVISTLRWNHHCICDHLLERPDEWQSMGDLARVAWGQSNLNNKQRARCYLPKLARTAADRGVVIVIDPTPEKEGDLNPHNRAMRVKIANFSDEKEKQAVIARLDKMRDRRDVTIDTYDRLRSLVERKLFT